MPNRWIAAYVNYKPLRKVADWLKGLAFLEVLEYAGKLAILIGVITFFQKLEKGENCLIIKPGISSTLRKVNE
ncbi:MAG: hypothetical protein HC827_12560 [Cyanobacteria bacterium RM1_2_2]|nr:hypothetical protein [Cyanobacteria bacterium RM1_2_2]